MVRAMQVSSAVIPAAGAGTRFLPATKAVPKELMPIGDTPAIQLIIDEALGAGVEHIVVISSHAKPAIERYFERDDALIEMLREKGNDDAADRLAAIGRDWRVTITYQDDPRGRDELAEQQVHQQEMPQVVDREGGLIPVLSKGGAADDLDPGVADDRP